MKIAIASDLHLEFGDLDFDNDFNSDVLILGGDILVAKQLGPRDAETGHVHNQRYHAFMQRCSQRFSRVIYIAGNHEHYDGDIAKTLPNLRENLAYLSNVSILEKEVVKIDDVIFVCGTLWTDMNREDPLTLTTIRTMLNDYQVIKDSREPVYFRDSAGTFRTRVGNFLPQTSVEEHREMMLLISETVTDNPGAKIVVVGHHAPSKSSIKPKYQGNHIMNGAYSSDLVDFILDRPEILLWTHGHTHDDFDYLIGSCRVVCNPRGYIGYEAQANSWKLKTVEI